MGYKFLEKHSTRQKFLATLWRFWNDRTTGIWSREKSRQQNEGSFASIFNVNVKIIWRRIHS